MANYTQFIPQLNSTTYPVSITDCFNALTVDITALETDKLNLTGGILTGNLDIQGSALSIGIGDSTAGIFRVYGAGTGNIDGGQINIYNSADHDTTVNFWVLDAYTDTFRIFGQGLADTAITIDTNSDIVFGGNINIGDSNNLNVGTNDDLRLFHDGSNSYIQINSGATGDFFIRNVKPSSLTYFTNDTSGGVLKNTIVTGGASPYVRLYYNGNKKLETTNLGVSIGTINSSSILHIGDDGVGDSNYITIGKGYDSTSGINWQRGGLIDASIEVDNSEHLVIDYDKQNLGNSVIFKANNVTVATFDSAGDLLLNNSINFVDNGHLYVGTNNDLDIYHNGFDNFIETSNGDLYIRQLSGANKSILINNQTSSGLTVFKNDDSLSSLKKTLELGGATPNVKLFYDGTQQQITTASGGPVLDASPTVGDNSLKIATTAYVDTSIAAIPTPSFRGALVSENFTAITVTTGVERSVPLADEKYDTDAIHDSAGLTTRLTVPAGVTKVILRADIAWASNSTGFRRAYFRKGGTSYSSGQGRSTVTPVNGNSTIHSLSSAVLEVTAGNYFEVVAYQNSGGNLNILILDTWMSMEIIE